MKLRVSAFNKNKTKTRWSGYWLQQMGQNRMNVFRVQSKENTSNFHFGFYNALSTGKPCESRSSRMILFPLNMRPHTIANEFLYCFIIITIIKIFVTSWCVSEQELTTSWAKYSMFTQNQCLQNKWIKPWTVRLTKLYKICYLFYFFFRKRLLI